MIHFDGSVGAISSIEKLYDESYLTYKPDIFQRTFTIIDADMSGEELSVSENKLLWFLS